MLRLPAVLFVLFSVTAMDFAGASQNPKIPRFAQLGGHDCQHGKRACTLARCGRL